MAVRDFTFCELLFMPGSAEALEAMAQGVDALGHGVVWARNCTGIGIAFQIIGAVGASFSQGNNIIEASFITTAVLGGVLTLVKGCDLYRIARANRPLLEGNAV
ncbi:MAG: hypothetical protein JSR76_05070 [Verrucomicrobia bacterium]|nr:hypothetical protein [Verrucomicrobiota bacterium]